MRVHSPTPTPYAPTSGTMSYPRIIRNGSGIHPVGARGARPGQSGVQASRALQEIDQDLGETHDSR